MGALVPPVVEIYQAAVQYERAGRISTRVDAGYIVSPIGLGMMDRRVGRMGAPLVVSY